MIYGILRSSSLHFLILILLFHILLQLFLLFRLLVPSSAAAPILLFFLAVYSIINLALFPHEFSQFAAWVFVGPFTMPHIVFELTFVYLSIDPLEFAPSIFQVFKILSLKIISINSLPDTPTLPLSLEKLSFISTPVAPLVDPLPMEATVLKSTHICISIDQFFSSQTMFDTFQHLPSILNPLFRNNCRTSCLLPSHEVTDIFRIFFINVLAKTMRFAFLPFTLIRHESLRVLRIAWKQFDTAFTIFDSIFELSPVEIFVRNVFKAHPLLLTLSWKVGIPTPQVERSTKIPQNVFALIYVIVHPIFKFPADKFVRLSFDLHPEKLKCAWTEQLHLINGQSQFR